MVPVRSCTRKIELLNVNEGEVYPHRLIYVTGQITSDNDSRDPDFVIASVNNCHDTKWQVVDGRFKCFLLLDVGNNVIKFRCGNDLKASCEFTCHYRARKSPNSVKFVYIKCKDSAGEFQTLNNCDNSLEHALELLKFNSLLCQLFFAECLVAAGFPRSTFCMSPPEVFQSELTASESLSDDFLEKSNKIFWYFYEELERRGVITEDEKIVGVLGCTRYQYEHREMRTRQTIRPHDHVKCHTAATAGNLALIGGGGLYSWADSCQTLATKLSNTCKVDRTRLFDDSGGRGTWGGVYSTTLGSLLHEMGHLFDLDHTCRGVMGRGFDDVMCWVLPREQGFQSLHPSPSKAEERWWWDWGGAMFERASLTLLTHHMWFILVKTGSLVSKNKSEIDEEIYSKSDIEEDCWLVRTSGTVGPVSSVPTEQFQFGICSECDTENLANCRLFTNDVLYYDEQYVRGVRVRNVLYGDVAENSEIIPCLNRIYSIRVRAGAIIDAIQFRTDPFDLASDSAGELELRTTKWFGGKGGSLTEFLITDEMEPLLGTISKFGEVNCVSSLQISAVNNQSVETVSLRSKTEILAVVLYCKDQDRVWFYKDFRFGETQGAMNNGNEYHNTDPYSAKVENMPTEDLHVSKEVKFCELLPPSDCKPSIWSLQLQGTLKNGTIKTVDIKGVVRCFFI